MYSLNAEYIINTTVENPISVGLSYQSTLYARGQSHDDNFEGFRNISLSVSYYL